MIAGLITTVTGTRSRMRSGKSETQMEHQWNANGTQMERIDERVPDEFQTLFLLGYF